MKDEVKITVIATGFKDIPHRRIHAESTVAAVHSARTVSAHAYEVIEPQVPVARQPEPMERPRPAAYAADNFDEFESEIVRHAEPVESGAGRAFEMNASAEREPVIPIEPVTSSVNIRYDSNDLEVPAFMRKRADG